jgi:hypothetical protein
LYILPIRRILSLLLLHLSFFLLFIFSSLPFSPLLVIPFSFHPPYTFINFYFPFSCTSLFSSPSVFFLSSSSNFAFFFHFVIHLFHFLLFLLIFSSSTPSCHIRSPFFLLPQYSFSQPFIIFPFFSFYFCPSLYFILFLLHFTSNSSRRTSYPFLLFLLFNVIILLLLAFRIRG